MSSEVIVLEGSALIDGSGGTVIDDAMVVMSGTRIIYAGPRTHQFDKVPAERHNLLGKTIIPGLIEAHTHAVSEADMYAYIKNGITTVRFAGLNTVMEAQLRNKIAKGDLLAPRLISCGPMIDQPPAAYPEWSVTVDTPDDAIKVTEQLITEHDLHSIIVTQRITAPVMGAIIDTAHHHECSVVGQTWAVDGKEAAILGIDELHTSSRVFASSLYSTDDLLRYNSIPERLAMASRAWASIDWQETQAIIETMVEHEVSYCGMHVITQYQVGDGVTELEADDDYKNLFDQSHRDSFQDFVQRLQGNWSTMDHEYARIANDQRVEWLRRFRQTGGVLLAGTDMQFGGIMLHREIRNLEFIGMTPLEAITAATGGCAKALHLETDYGLLRAGLSGDLVVLNGNPLRDLAALRDISMVYKEGRAMWSLSTT